MVDAPQAIIRNIPQETLVTIGQNFSELLQTKPGVRGIWINGRKTSRTDILPQVEFHILTEDIDRKDQGQIHALTGKLSRNFPDMKFSINVVNPRFLPEDFTQAEIARQIPQRAIPVPLTQQFAEAA